MSASFVYASAGRWRFNYTTASAWGIPPQNLIEPLAKIPHYAIKFIAMPPVFQMLSFFPIIFPTIFVFFFFGSEREKNSRQDFGKLPSWQRPITHSTDKHHHHGTVAQVYKKSR